MAINITQTMNSFHFENKENLRNAARDILNRQGASSESMQKIMEQTIFDTKSKYDSLYQPQLAIIKASSQISANGNLKETLKYLKNQANKKTHKEPVLGEIWDLFSQKETSVYTGELSDIEIDLSKNIFIAA